jgi:hypothetical protein
MPREAVGPRGQTTARAVDRSDWQKKEPQRFEEFLTELNAGPGEALGVPLQSSERELVRELVQALRTIRYGSIVLVIHEGRVVEVNKTVRIRTGRTSKKE